MKSYTTSAVRYCVAFIISLAQKERHCQSAVSEERFSLNVTKLSKRGDETNQFTSCS